MENKTKIRIVLTSVTVLFLLLIGHLMVIDYEWTVKKLAIGSFAFFGTFIISSNAALFVTLLIFGIFVLPFVINELGFLDNSLDEPPDNFDVETGQTIEEAEEQVDRLAGFLKSRFGSVKKIKSYMLPIGVASAILGGYLMILPSFLLKDSEPVWIPKTEEMHAHYFVEQYYGFIRGQLLIVGILILIVGSWLIIRFRRKEIQK
jgi:hypothetical protein